jgi:hypothetical protein
MTDQLFTITNSLNTNDADVILSFDHDDDAGTYYFFDPISENWIQMFLSSSMNKEGDTPEISITVISRLKFLEYFVKDMDEDEHWFLRQVSKKAIQTFLEGYPDNKEYRHELRIANPEGYIDCLEELINSNGGITLDRG